MMEKLCPDHDVVAVAAQYREIRERIDAACRACGRSADEVTLIGVTKTVSPLLINAAIDAGLTDIGENRVQEYLAKEEDLHLDGVKRHLIGHLQTNKVRSIVGKVDMIQSVDSLRLAQVIDRISAERGICTSVLVEVNIGEENSKSGIFADDTEQLMTELSKLRNISVEGLMTVPPISETDAKKHHYFSKMRELFIDIQRKNIDNIHMRTLSMGMSDDFECAIAEGSTMVRVGTAIFGRRAYPAKSI